MNKKICSKKALNPVAETSATPSVGSMRHLAECLQVAAVSAMALAICGCGGSSSDNEFKRIDGAGLHEHWRQWYPFMLEMH